MLVYLLTNTVNGKYYVGQTTQPLRNRLRLHASRAKTSNRKAPLQAAIHKYGLHSFDVGVLSHAASIEELNALERLWIAVLSASEKTVGYNCNSGGDSKRPTEESRRRMSLAHMGKKIPKDQLERRVNSQRGQVRSERCRDNMRRGAAGRKMSVEGLAKFRASMVGRAPWSKGKTGIRIGRVKGFHLTEEHRAKISAAHLRNSRERQGEK